MTFNTPRSDGLQVSLATIVLDSAMDRPKSTGQTQRLREVLREKRESNKWSRQKVADLMVRRLKELEPITGEKAPDTFTGESVRQYENRIVQPPIDKFAAWAWALGFRLIVELEERGSRDRPPGSVVLVKHTETADIARLVDEMPRHERARLLKYVESYEDPAIDADS